MSENNLEKIKQDLDRLIELGNKMILSLTYELDKADKEFKKKFPQEKLPIFSNEYEGWYSEAYYVIKQILPNRVNDFTIMYRNDKRKEITYLSYTMSDYMLGLQTTRGGQIVVGQDACFTKFQAQLAILKAASRRFASTLFDIKQIVQAELFDNELDGASELLKNGFFRGAGVISGVVLEKHLSDVCLNHEIKAGKKNPTIADFNDVLKNNEIIEVPLWRFIQRLGDLRNICGHNKEREPERDEVSELIEGVKKITKTLY